jgi:cation diffusion facilitator family transporter
MKKPACQKFCGRYYGWISFVCNLFNAAFKIGIGTLTGSQALVADGFHSLSDSLTAIVTIVTLAISGKPSDEGHPYGHGKIEFLSASFFSLILMTFGFVLMGRSIYALMQGHIEPPNFLAMGPALVSILVNIAISNYGLCVGREISSPVITANAKENRADAYSSIASLVGIMGALIGYPFLDPLAAIAVSLLIIYMGSQIMRDSGSGLMDSSIDKNERQAIRRFTRSIPGVREIAYLKTRRIGQKIWADVGVVVAQSTTLNEGDRVAHEVRNCLMRNFPHMQDAVVYLDSDRERTAKGGPAGGTTSRRRKKESR